MIIYKNYNIKKLTTLSVDNMANIVFEIIDANEIYILKYLFDYFDLKYHVLGKGSKVLFKDEYIIQPIILISDKFEELIINDNHIIVSSGYDNKKLILRLSNHNLGGFHQLYPLPASIGGMIYMNASDSTSCISKFIDKVMVIDDKNKILIIDKNDCKFTYRSSIFQNKKYIILYCSLIMNFVDKSIIIEQIKESINYRIMHQEVNKKTCGSIFKNPINKKAYELINGIKNQLEINKVILSNKHSNILINNGASCVEIYNYIMKIKQLVKDEYGVELQEELNIL